MADFIKGVSPKGVAQYPWLVKPDTRYDADGVFKTGLILPGDAETTKEFMDKFRDIFVEEYGQKKLSKANLPFDIDEETGDVVFKFKSKSRPRLFDSKGNPIQRASELKIGGGTVIKISYSAKTYDTGSNTGVTCYLNAVQIIDLVEYKSGNEFGEEEGSFTEASGGSYDEGTHDEDDNNAAF